MQVFKCRNFISKVRDGKGKGVTALKLLLSPSCIGSFYGDSPAPLSG